MKTKEELNNLKREVEALNTKLAELTEDELKQVIGGVDFSYDRPDKEYEFHNYSIPSKYTEKRDFTKKFIGAAPVLIDPVPESLEPIRK